jgi:branched-chain amino acid aminotransferase
LDRFEKSAKLMNLDFPEKNRLILIGKILDLIAKNKFQHSGLRLCLTGGYSQDIFTPTEPNFIILEQEIKENIDYQGFIKGEKLILFEYVRDIYEVKTTNYIVPIRLQERWKSENAVDVLYHKDGLVSESSRSNFFIVKNNDTIVTPLDQVLYGITRKKIIELAQKYALRIEIRDLTLAETLEAKEAFITSSTKGLLPIVKLDENTIGNGKVGSVSRFLMEEFRALQLDYIQNFKY